jgi:hypothetical protein
LRIALLWCVECHFNGFDQWSQKFTKILFKKIRFNFSEFNVKVHPKHVATQARHVQGRMSRNFKTFRCEKAFTSINTIFFRKKRSKAKTKKLQMLKIPFTCRTRGLFECGEHLQGARKPGQWQTECVRSVETLFSHKRRSTQSRSEESREQRKINYNIRTVSILDVLRHLRRHLMIVFIAD